MKLTKPLVILDLETTGIWVEKDRIVEIGMIKRLPDGGVENYVKRVNPGIPIPPMVTKLIGISDADVKDAPHFKDLAREVMAFIGDADLGGFNVERFDLPVLEREFFEAGITFEWRSRAIYDAQKIYHIHEQRDLMAAFQFYCGKNLEKAHSASDDASAALEILEAQARKYGEGNDSIEALKEFDYERPYDYFDRERKFRWWNNRLYPTFGKYARKQSIDKIAQMDRPYLDWILTKDFSDEVKEMVEKVLQGHIPELPKSE